MGSCLKVYQRSNVRSMRRMSVVQTPILECLVDLRETGPRSQQDGQNLAGQFPTWACPGPGSWRALRLDDTASALERSSARIRIVDLLP